MAAPSLSARVWDLPTRLFHWSLVALVATLVVTGKQGRMDIHAAAGEAVIILVLFRLVWGFVGSQRSRFVDFIKGPRHVLKYLTRQHAHDGPGHNPAGGWMVVVLLAALLTQAVLGLFASDDILFDGPLFHLIDKATSDLFTGLHKRLFLGLIGLVGLHLTAVVVHWLALGDNLVWPMITGRKPVAADQDRAFVHPFRAVVIVAGMGAVVWAILAVV